MRDFVDELVAAAKPGVDEAVKRLRPIVDVLRMTSEGLTARAGIVGFARYRLSDIESNGQGVYCVEIDHAGRWRSVFRVCVPVGTWPVRMDLFGDDWDVGVGDVDEMREAILTRVDWGWLDHVIDVEKLNRSLR